MKGRIALGCILVGVLAILLLWRADKNHAAMLASVKAENPAQESAHQVSSAPPVIKRTENENSEAAKKENAAAAKRLLNAAAKNLDFKRGVSIEIEQLAGAGQKLQMKQINGVMCSRLEMEIGGKPAVLIQNEEGLWVVIAGQALKADFAYGAVGANVKQLSQGVAPQVTDENRYSMKETWSNSGESMARVIEEIPEEKMAAMVSVFSMGAVGTKEERLDYATNNLPASVSYDIDPTTETMRLERRYNVKGQPVGALKTFASVPPEGIPESNFSPGKSLPRKTIKSFAEFTALMRKN